MQIHGAEIKLNPQHLPPGNVRFHQSQHAEGGLVELDKHSVVDLPQAKELQYLPNLRAHTVDTAVEIVTL